MLNQIPYNPTVINQFDQIEINGIQNERLNNRTTALILIIIGLILPLCFPLVIIGICSLLCDCDGIRLAIIGLISFVIFIFLCVCITTIICCIPVILTVIIMNV